jgi:uncharacterized membrane protein
MTAVLLSLTAALSYGLADFTGGFAARRAGAWTVAFVAQAVSAAATLVVALVLPGDPTGSDLAWAVAAGVANGLGTAFLYRGLSSGRMGVVAPVSGVGAAVVPVLAGVGLGERPAALAWVGIAAALPGIWLVSREPGPAASAPASSGSGLVDGVLAGLGFGLLFVCLGRFTDDAGLLPLALNQAVAGAAIVVLALVSGVPWWPRERGAGWGALAGLLAVTATVAFLLANRTGLLSVSAVITSLYPAFTVLLAASVLRERIHAGQALGLALCGCCVALVAAG